MTANRLRYFPNGRKVWLREGPRWIPVIVGETAHGSLTVRDATGRAVYVHFSMLHRALRTTDPHR